MDRLSYSDYLAHLTADSARFADVLAGADPSASVPACPAWTAADLLHHLTEVQHFWQHVVTVRPEPPKDYVEPTPADDYQARLAAFDEASRGLRDALAAADPADESWTWTDDRTVGFSFRRQALEALIHRVDAEQTTGQASTIDAALAADGVHEVLATFYGGAPDNCTFSGLPHYVRIDLTDTGDAIWTQLGHVDGTDDDGIEHHEDGIVVVDDPGQEPDAVISGTAEALLLRLWRRGDGGDTHLTGDLAMVDHFRNATHRPLD